MPLKKFSFVNIKDHVIKQLNHDDIEIQRKSILVYFFSVIGFIFLLVFGTVSLFNIKILMGTFLLGAASFTLINFLMLIKTSNLDRSANGVTFIIFLISLFLITTGGAENTGPLWTYTTIPLILYLQGFARGLAILVAYLLVTIFILFVPSQLHAFENYSYVFKTRLVASFSAMLMLSWVYEYSSNKTYKRWRKLSELHAKQARTDVLTGVSNRRDIEEKLEYENLRAKRRKEEYSILLIDIDHFKSINDRYGHDAGDEVLQKVAHNIKSTMFLRDVVGRWGGEEFLVLLPENNRENATLAAEKIRISANKAIFHVSGQDITVSISIGVATSDATYKLESYIKIADECLYKAKSKGRNCVVNNAFGDMK